ncbi:MAG TPA: hypothetical protein VHR72_06395, partial [Gemmataceae bacterium]|nr:hypothetical protein [Gemmataceae bacterium]
FADTFVPSFPLSYLRPPLVAGGKWARHFIPIFPRLRSQEQEMNELTNERTSNEKVRTGSEGRRGQESCIHLCLFHSFVRYFVHFFFSFCVNLSTSHHLEAEASARHHRTCTLHGRP